jgi:hypothetical protein
VGMYACTCLSFAVTDRNIIKEIMV